MDLIGLIGDISVIVMSFVNGRQRKITKSIFQVNRKLVYLQKYLPETEKGGYKYYLHNLYLYYLTSYYYGLVNSRGKLSLSLSMVINYKSVSYRKLLVFFYLQPSEINTIFIKFLWDHQKINSPNVIFFDNDLF